MMLHKTNQFSIFHFPFSISFSLLIAGLFIGITSCIKKNEQEYYHRFTNHYWYRFNILQFEIPVEKTGQRFDVYFFIRHNRDYEFNTMDFNMVMITPSGEERIREYHMDIKNRAGNFTGRFAGDSCEVSTRLTSELQFPKQGILIIKIENLIPRMETHGLLGAGIRMKPPG